MRFLLLHSPLVTSKTWSPLVPVLERRNQEVSVVSFDNNIPADDCYNDHHISQLHAEISNIKNELMVAVAHSGAGNVLASVDPTLFHGHIFLDATFPIATASRFDLFDEQDSVERWRKIAGANNGVLPRESLTQLGHQIDDTDCRRAFENSLVDVPIKLYEEQTTVHSRWPNVKNGLYVRWTSPYKMDAERARQANFQVRTDSDVHFKMLNQPERIADTLIDFANTLARDN